MSDKLKIKQLRRAETMIDDEITYSSRMLRSNSKFNSPSLAVEAGVNAAKQYIDKLNELLDTKYTIRKLISDFNEEKGINKRCVEMALLEQEAKAVNNVLDALDTPYVRSNYQNDSEYYEIGLSQAVIDEYRSTLRTITRKIQKLKDACNGINSQEDVVVPQQVVDVLEKYNFID